jgi:TrmH family RNA methyltransferase
MLISSIDNQKIKDIKKLETKKERDLTGLFIIEGEHLVYEAYKEGLLKTLIVRDGYPFLLDVDTIYVSDKVLKHLSSLTTPTPVLGVVKKRTSKSIGNKVIALDNVQDPGNLGTIIRSAVAFNFDTIILSDDTVDLYNPKVIRATQGMIFKINIVIGNLVECIKKLKENKYEIYGTDVTSGKSVKSIEKRKKFAIIMGNEGNGISKDVKSLCSNFIYIPMNKDCESLNVAVAASIILYELNE